MERLLPVWCCASLVVGAASAEPVHVDPEAGCFGASTRYNWRGCCPMLVPGIGAELTEVVYWRAVGDYHSHAPRLHHAYAYAYAYARQGWMRYPQQIAIGDLP